MTDQPNDYAIRTVQASCLAALVVLVLAAVCGAQPDRIPVPKSMTPYGLVPALNRYSDAIDTLEQRTHPADSVTDALTRQVPLDPGVYVVREPITLDGRHGLTLSGPSGGLMDPRGWARVWWEANPQSQCIVCFDLPEGVPGIHLVGCRAVTFRGINFCRSTPGPLFLDERKEGMNSGEIRFERVGFYRRVDSKNALVDPLKGLGFDAQQAGYHALSVRGVNGADNYHFRDCDFHALDRCLDIDCQQTTRVTFTACNFRQSNHLAWCKGSGNLSFYGCQRYDCGPVVYEKCGIATCSMLWSGGWLDCSGGEEMQPLVDFSRTAYGSLAYEGGNGKQITGPSQPLVIPPQRADRTWVHLHGLAPWGQTTTLE